MFKLSILSIIAAVLLLLSSCGSTAYILKPDNFAAADSGKNSFIFAAYLVDTPQYFYFSFSGGSPDLLLNRNQLNVYRPGKLVYTIIPLEEGVYPVKSVYFNKGQFSECADHTTCGLQGAGNHYPFYIFPYTMEFKTAPGKITYVGRIVLTNGAFSLEDHFDEDKALLLANFESDQNAFVKLTNSEFHNSFKK